MSTRLGPRPQLVTESPPAELFEARDGVLRALQAENERGEALYFQQDGTLFRATRHSGPPVVEALTEKLLGEELDRLNSHLDPETLSGLLQLLLRDRRHAEDILIVSSIRRTPFFSRRGLVYADGYDCETGIWLWADKNLTIPAVHPNPAQEDITAAKELISDDLLGDIDFCSDSDYASAVAALVFPCFVQGPAPLVIVSGPGAAELISRLLLVHVGREDQRILADISRKDLCSDVERLLRTGTCALLDTFTGILDEKTGLAFSCGDLARTFGLSWSLPNRTLWLVDNNKVSVGRRTEQRALQIHLSSAGESYANDRPEILRRWFLDNRGRILWALLTLIQNWVSQGSPAFDGEPLPGHLSFSRSIGGILRAASIGKFLDDRQSPEVQALVNFQSTERFLRAWADAHFCKPVNVPVLIPLARTHAAHLLGDGAERSQRTRLGIELGKLCGLTIAGFRIVRADFTDAKSRPRTGWRLVTVTKSV